MPFLNKMQGANSKKQLTIILQQLKSFENPNIKLEQYETPADIAAEWIWEMHINNEIEEKVFADFACGPGILGIGLLLMGAKQVHFLDIDKKILETCKENCNNLEIDQNRTIYHNMNVQESNIKTDCVVQNPPFGTKIKHVDKLFLETAFKTANKIYSMHKWSTKKFIEAISKDHNFTISRTYRYKFPLKKTMKHHKKKKEFIDVGLWKLEK